VVLGRDLLPTSRAEQKEDVRPRLRLSEASGGKKGEIRRA